MYIEISKDVVDDAIEKANLKVNDSLDLLHLMAIFSSKGNHVVSVPCLRHNKALVDKLGQIIGQSNVFKLRRSESLFYMIQTIKPTLSVYCIITYSQDTIHDGRAINVNPAKMKKFEPYLRTKLITENLLDALFFNFIANYYIRGSLYSGIKTRYEATPGGGSTTCDVLKHEILDGKRFCLVIADSDKKCPTQQHYGDTAGNILDILRLYPSILCGHYIMEQVMEVENLIPKRIVRQYASNKTDLDVLDKDCSFFDMKSGLTLKGLYRDDVYRYQSSLFKDLNFKERNEAKNNTTNRDEYEQYIDSHHMMNVLKNGFGSDLLKNVTCACDNKGRIRYPELKDEMMNKIKASDLTAEQKAEWNKIGKLLFSWTCGLPSKSY